MKKVLVIDDDQDILEAISIVLQSDGFESITSTKGEEAYKIATDYDPDLIIIDLLLSGVDGSVVCNALKHEQSTKDIPIIMISAHPSAKESARVNGADGFIAKPFSIEGLLSEVKRFTN